MQRWAPLQLRLRTGGVEACVLHDASVIHMVIVRGPARAGPHISSVALSGGEERRKEKGEQR